MMKFKMFQVASVASVTSVLLGLEDPCREITVSIFSYFPCSATKITMVSETVLLKASINHI